MRYTEGELKELALDWRDAKNVLALYEKLRAKTGTLASPYDRKEAKVLSWMSSVEAGITREGQHDEFVALIEAVTA